jgi:hypothetical protein
MTFDIADLLIAFIIGGIFGAVFVGLITEANKHELSLMHTRSSDIDERDADFSWRAKRGRQD